MDSQTNTNIIQAAKDIASGRVVAYPTEAVWGLGCDPFNQDAVEKILALKKRSVKKGVILVAGEISQVDFLLDGLPENKLEQLKRSWPGPFTWLVPHDNRVPEFIYGAFDTVAVRVSAHPIVKALCEHYGGPIVSTSANPQALPPALTEEEAFSYFGEQISYCSGSVGEQAQPSQIQHLMTGEIIRSA